MARGKLFYLPGQIWHITHRCHNRSFLLKFPRDRKRWLFWLFQARKKYGLEILNYIVTSNHIHLLVYDGPKQDTIPNSIRLAAGCLAREYNQRKNRRGAFWEDNYHATAIESGKHLIRCMLYIDLNMVRAGVAKTPEDWAFCGYNEIFSNRQRYRLINMEKLTESLNFQSIETLRVNYRIWIEDTIASDSTKHEKIWTECVAVGSKDYVDEIKSKLGSRARHRTIIHDHKSYLLR